MSQIEYEISKLIPNVQGCIGRDYLGMRWYRDRDDPIIVPAMSDDATKGAVLGFIRRKWRGDVWIGCRLMYPGRLAWVVCGLTANDGIRINGTEGFDTEEEAMLAGLKG